VCAGRECAHTLQEELLFLHVLKRAGKMKEEAMALRRTAETSFCQNSLFPLPPAFISLVNHTRATLSCHFWEIKLSDEG